MASRCALRRLVAAAALAFLSFAPTLTTASPYNELLVDFNLNTNKDATSVLDYSTDRRSNYTKSPDNWRSIPFYTILPDKFADGDPSNNDYFGTMYEADWRETQLRYGGDLKGLENKLDYLAGMGVKGIFMSGTVFLNMPWQADSYSPLDFTVLDPHYGTIAEWQATIDAIHARGMYFMADFTVGTMGDLISFKGSENTSTQFDINEHEQVWKKPSFAPWNFTEYKDFNISNVRNTSCVLPKLWLDDATLVDPGATNGCLESEFDAYGDMEAFGVHPDWQRQLSKFASVQDRLREWKPEVMAKLQVFACLAISALDLDAIRVDKSTQMTVDGLADWGASTRKCAADLGKKNFLITGEVTGGDTFGALYLGRGRTPTQRPDFSTAANLTGSEDQYFLRDSGLNGLDGFAFHYSTYRSLTRFLGMDGNLQVAFDVDSNFVTSWKEMFVNDDFVNPNTNEIDPKHMFGTSNFDIFRWPSVENGTQKNVMASFITTLLMPGIPLLYYGEEQNFYIFDTGASNYLYGRQAMMGNTAWQRHGCYALGSDQYYNLNLRGAVLGCRDDWNSLDHFDPTSSTRRMMARMLQIREQYAVVQDGFGVDQYGNWTYEIVRPGSNGTATEMGLWSAARSAIDTQNLGNSSDKVWLLYTNENDTRSYTFDCDTEKTHTPFQSGTTVQNLFAPYETYTLVDSTTSYFNDGKQPMFGCIQSLTMEPFGFKALVPVAEWVAPLPALTKFTPGHDARLPSNGTNSVDISFEFNTVMSCDSVTAALSLNMSSSGHGNTPTFSKTAVKCGAVTNPDPSPIAGGDTSQWSWAVTLQNVPDGILTLTLDNPKSSGGVATGSVDTLMLRIGAANNVMVFPNSDYNNTAFTYSNGQYFFEHTAYGADMFRYSWNFGMNWTDWASWEDTTTIDKEVFSSSSNFWDGDHIMVQYWSQAAASVAHVVHADYKYKYQRRVPQFLARGPYNSWGFDKGISAQMTHAGDGRWELEIMASWPTYVQLNVWGYDEYYYGDTDGDGVMDRLPPNTAAPNYLNMSAPPLPHLAWNLVINDRDLSWSLEPRGQSYIGAIIYGLLVSIPLITGTLAVLIFMWSFYGIKYNKYGLKPAKDHKNYFPILGSLGNKSASDFKDGTVSEKKSMFSHHKHHGEIIGWPEDKNKRRKVLIATLEYEIIDWKLKVKIGGLGVMSSLMGKAMTDVDLIWVVPKVKDIEYPQGDPADPIEVIIFGEPYLIEVETHTLDNITYVILDSPVFRAQTKADPYPARMDDLSSAIFYSTWNQAIANTIRRYPDIDIYHINDYHGALAPIYLLPKVMPVCLSLHNAEFQGLWPLRTKEEMKEVCSAFNISKEHCTKYVQFGNTFNLLHAAASFISVHQKSVGVAGVSDKYGKRSWARYPALWTLKHVDSLPNPDPADIAALDEAPIDVKHMNIDQVAEAERPEHKRQAQEWAGIKQDPNADLFVFVGRWSKQKGVDLIADIMPSLLEKKPSIQLITVGPVIDLYGRFAAEKLARLMEMYPDRVFSKPEFTALPPYLFSGADFALIPSRDEPFGLVAVEFGRKGALGVGSRLGGLGLMPGWWFPVESSSTGHMLSQLGKTIKMALKSTEEERALLRARSAVQRFPVIEWRQRTEDFHKRSITISREMAGANAWRPSDGGERGHAAISDHDDWNPEQQPYPTQPDWDKSSIMSGSPRMSVTPMTPGSPGQWSDNTTPGEHHLAAPPRLGDYGRRGSFSTDVSDPEGDYFSNSHSRQSTDSRQDYSGFLDRANRVIAKEQRHAPDPFLDAQPTRPFGAHSRVSSVESISSIVDEKSNSPLNKAVASFTDADGGVAHEFAQKLHNLSAENSIKDLCIEKFLMKSEEQFFHEVKKEKLASSAASLRSKRDSVWGTPSIYEGSRPSSPNAMSFGPSSNSSFDDRGHITGDMGPEVVQMTRLQLFLAREIGGWPLYTIIIALGQMLSATSFQITLLSGQNWETDLQLYVLGGVFLAASGVWYTLFRLKPSVYILSAPWLFFGIAFFLIGLPSVADVFVPAHDALSSAATWSYAVASAAAFAFFGLNFGEEAGAATEVWMLRACLVQGSQQIWVAALWYWGDKLNGSVSEVAPWWVACVLFPLAAMSFLFAYLMLFGLPEYYRQTPPKVPGFLKTLFRRKIVLWFLASEILRDYWLSGPYGRNWSFLWSVDIPAWQTLLLVIGFFIGVWALMLAILTYFAKTHTWLLPVFAVGLGAPRWCQMLWGTSSLALYIPWARTAGPYLGISLWLWLGVLDAVQGVGLGMILLQTLSRLHVCATLAFAQIIGSVCVMVARATAPNRVGPESVFPDAAKWDFSEGLKDSPMASAAFWVALACQIIIVFGYFWFYRKEQLSRP
ncbi:modular protein with glycoside hydrolase family 13 and glycosyltransferase family 5 domains [Punctularia strigosozonata HHB-11173 SS5]|uniref:modular protein with glycoside hydrolase family 13 and glycosyltransferase family 5 domains n=1 Tax=Punctularia strigosozonata (strain HHB-11173) TaxID=741275 RepID=UPI00044169E6|nr:modular protein with glycoside hydrolase family 13 and glycosyltransferase family 5 domains [Punctularia strigosozonata HHB-11173 SS5]EIN07319.1 modular protein with glycoside hydrolase family 13 and glycosyltransferase family 5 domains [Punctularia strigosozonata HHB-11173 SS5]